MFTLCCVAVSETNGSVFTKESENRTGKIKYTVGISKALGKWIDACMRVSVTLAWWIEISIINGIKMRAH